MKKIILSTISPEKKYIQLGLHNLKAHALEYCRCRKDITIDIHEITTKHNVYMFGSIFPSMDKKELFRYAVQILKKKPMMIGFSCFMWNIESILQVCKVIKSIDSGIPIILGGGEASADPESLLLNHTCIDFIVPDEGELAFSELVDAFYYRDTDISQIKGIVYRQRKDVIKTEHGGVVDLQKLPSPYLNHQIKPNKNLNLTLETSRGCPFNCSYCTYSIRGYHKLRFIPIERILKELKYVLKLNPKSLRITDDNFNINPPRAALLLKQIARYVKDTDIKIFLNASMWKIDKNLIRLLKKVDMTCSVGVQSVNDNPLRYISRKNDFKVFEDNLKTFDEMGLQYELSFILGLPGEDYEEFKDSIDWAFRFNPKEINIFPLMVFKGTKMNVDAGKLGLKTYGEPYYTIRETKKMSKNDIQKGLMLREHLGLLYNKGLLKNTLRYISRQYDLPLTEIIERCGHCPSFLHAVKGSAKVQKNIVAYFVNKYENKLDKQHLSKVMHEDFISYIGK